MCLVLCYAKRFPSAVRGRIHSFSWDAVAPLYSLLFRPFWSVFDVDNLLEELGRNCVAPQDTPVRRPTEFLHVEVGLVLRVGFGFNGDTNEKHTQILMGQVLQILLNLRCVWILA